MVRRRVPFLLHKFSLSFHFLPFFFLFSEMKLTWDFYIPAAAAGPTSGASFRNSQLCFGSESLSDPNHLPTQFKKHKNDFLTGQINLGLLKLKDDEMNEFMLLRQLPNGKWSDWKYDLRDPVRLNNPDG